jgi:copper(I)-binding protein
MLAWRMVLYFVLALLAGPVLAHDAKVGDLVIMEPWARATIGQVKTGAVYLTVNNHGAAGDRLLAVSTPVAAMAHLHSNIVDAGVMKMRPVEAIDIEAKGSTTLEPGGVHVMLMGVRNPLEEGDVFPMTLTFETAGSVDVEVHVQGIAAMRGGSGE